MQTTHLSPPRVPVLSGLLRPPSVGFVIPQTFVFGRPWDVFPRSIKPHNALIMRSSLSWRKREAKTLSDQGRR